MRRAVCAFATADAVGRAAPPVEGGGRLAPTVALIAAASAAMLIGAPKETSTVPVRLLAEAVTTPAKPANACSNC